MITKITNKIPKYNVIGAILAYLILIFAYKYFIIDKKMSPLDALILGLVIYGIFDMTNIAIFEDYDWKIALIDMLWGGILLYIITKIYYFLN